MALADTARMIASLELKDNFTKGILKASGSLDKFEGKVGAIGGKVAKGVAVAGAAVAAGAGIAIAGSIKAASEFEAQLNTINTVAQEGAAGLERIGDGIRDLARTTGTSHEDLTAAYYDLVSAGISAADAQNVLTQANKLAIGGLSTTAEAVDLLTTAINSYGGDASKAATFTDYFAQAIAAGKVTASELAGSFATVGPLAAQFGVGVDQIAAAVGVMTAKGTPAAEAMTQIRSAIVALKKPNAELSKLMKKTGVDFARLAKDKGLAFAYNELAKAAEKAGVPMEKLTGRVEGALFAAQVAGDEFANYSEELDNVRRSSEGVGVAQRQMDQRTKGAAFAFNRLKTNIRDIGITLGSALLPPLAELSDFFSQELAKPSTVAAIKSLSKSLASGLRDAVKWAKTLPWDQIGEGLKTAAGFAQGIISAFANMPPQAQAAIIGLAGLNKLSGGAVSGIVSELGKGLIKGVLGMTAAVVNLKAATVITGPGAGGGAGSIIPKAAGAAGLGLSSAAIASAAAIGAGIALPFVMFNVIPELTKGRPGSSGPTLETNTNPAQATTAVLNSLAQSMTATQQATIGVQQKVSTVSADIRNGFAVQGTALKNGFTTVTTGATETKEAIRNGFTTLATGGAQTKEAIRNGFTVNAAKTAALTSTTRTGDERTVSRIASMDSATRSGLAGVKGAATSTAAAIRNKRWQITVPVTVNNAVSVRAVTNGQTTVARYTGGTQTSRTIL